MSSGSSSSPIAVEPVTSANRTVTRRRSSLTRASYRAHHDETKSLAEWLRLFATTDRAAVAVYRVTPLTGSQSPSSGRFVWVRQALQRRPA